MSFTVKRQRTINKMVDKLPKANFIREVNYLNWNQHCSVKKANAK